MSQSTYQDIEKDPNKNISSTSQGDVVSAVTSNTQEDKSPAVQGPPPPPNGGLIAWLQVLGGFMLFFNTWGILNAFGVYQTYYEQGTLFKESSSNISWIGAIQATMLLMVGFITGPIYDRGKLRWLLIIGSFCIVFGHMMLSLCKTFGEVLCAQGFLVGIGAGCLFVPCVSILPTYFTTKLGAALGIAVSGSSVGGIIYPIVLDRLIGPLGFDWATRIIGFIALATLLIPITVMRQRVTPPKARSLIDWTALTDPSYIFFVFTTLIAFMGLFVLLFYISYFASAARITDSTMAMYIVPILNAGSVFGRTIPNALADRVGPFNLIAPCCTVVGILMLCMIAVTSQASLIVVAVLSGFFSGALIGLPPLCFVALTKDKSMIGTRIGMGFGIIGFGVLCGGPAGGAIIANSADFDWTGLWAFGGATAVFAGVMYSALRVAKWGVKLQIKA